MQCNSTNGLHFSLVCGCVHGVVWVRGGVIVSGNLSWLGRAGPGRTTLTICP